jgi:hypothetical protein
MANQTRNSKRERCGRQAWLEDWKASLPKVQVNFSSIVQDVHLTYEKRA